MVKPGKLIFQGKTVNALCSAHALKKIILKKFRAHTINTCILPLFWYI